MLVSYDRKLHQEMLQSGKYRFMSTGWSQGSYNILRHIMGINLEAYADTKAFGTGKF